GRAWERGEGECIRGGLEGEDDQQAHTRCFPSEQVVKEDRDIECRDSLDRDQDRCRIRLLIGENLPGGNAQSRNVDHVVWATRRTVDQDLTVESYSIISVVQAETRTPDDDPDRVFKFLDTIQIRLHQGPESWLSLELGKQLSEARLGVIRDLSREEGHVFFGVVNVERAA